VPDQSPDIQIFTTLSEAEAVWRRIRSNRRNYVFQTFDWTSLWFRTSAGSERVQPFIAHVSLDAGGSILFPLGIRFRYGSRTLVFLGGDVTDYNAPLVSEEALPHCNAAFVNRVWDAIVESARPDLVSLTRMPEFFADGTVNPFIGLPHVTVCDCARSAAPLPASFAEFMETRSRTYFSDTRRKRRKLERMGSLELRLPKTEEDISRIVDIMLAQKRRRIAETGARPMPAQQEQFYRCLAASKLCEGSPHLSALTIDGEPIATHLGVVHQRRFYWLMPGFESGSWARLSVGRILLQAVLEWCIENRIETFDLTVGDEDYKRFWANRTMQLFEARYAVTLTGSGLLAMRGLRHTRRRKPAAAA
jgi:CelD/BcsL family acetyltransferase involved in cellulose biosynthesis